MKIGYHKKFLKDFDKLPSKLQQKFYERLRIFSQDPFQPLLNNHSVDAAYPDFRSINVTGDYRALYQNISEDHVQFMRIGTYSELYG
jgi:addiction module RelE/StbE family toxin